MSGAGFGVIANVPESGLTGEGALGGGALGGGVLVGALLVGPTCWATLADRAVLDLEVAITTTVFHPVWAAGALYSPPDEMVPRL
jgi:hypothetical protein